MKIKFLILLVGLVVLGACKKEEEPTPDYSLIGRKGVLKFPEATAEITYISETQLHWKFTTSDGQVTEGDESVDYKRVADHLHFLNWIEQDGFTVSQLIDTKEKTVKAFWSYHDETSAEGNRGSDFVDASFEYK